MTGTGGGEDTASLSPLVRGVSATFARPNSTARVRWRIDPLSINDLWFLLGLERDSAGRQVDWSKDAGDPAIHELNELASIELITLGTLRATAATYRKWPPELQGAVVHEVLTVNDVTGEPQVWGLRPVPHYIPGCHVVEDMHPWRVHWPTRLTAYRDTMAALRSAGYTGPFALCKEPPAMWKAVGLTAFEHCTCTA